jgi:heme/copper-type cytochrome/quinol oxidase subunit 2
MNNPLTETANWEQVTTLFTVAESAIVILIMVLVAFLLLAIRRRKNKKDNQKVTPVSTVKS